MTGINFYATTSDDYKARYHTKTQSPVPLRLLSLVFVKKGSNTFIPYLF